jgi:hypothetical protein
MSKEYNIKELNTRKNPYAERIGETVFTQFGNQPGNVPTSKPTAIGGISRSELDAELAKGIESLKGGRTYTLEEVDAELAELMNVTL